MIKKRMSTIAPAKINLGLAVTGIKDDGYHLLQTVFQTISLCDQIEVELTGAGIVCDCGELSGTENLAHKAAAEFLKEYSAKHCDSVPTGIRITIQKHIPVQAGLAGGSTDAAATIRCLNKLCCNPFSYEELLSIASKCGSDTAFCLKGGTQWGEGTGTMLSSLPQAPAMDLVLVKPAQGVNTTEAYSLFDKKGKFCTLDKELWMRSLQSSNTEDIAKILFNSLEEPAFELVPEIKTIKQLLLQGGCSGALMSGSGSAVFGIVPNRDIGLRLQDLLAAEGFSETWLVKTIV